MIEKTVLYGGAIVIAVVTLPIQVVAAIIDRVRNER